MILDTVEDLYDNAPCGYMTTSHDGNIVKLNNTLLNWLGYERNELIGQKKFQELLPVGGRIFYETHHAPLLAMQGTVNELFYELKAKDGRRIPFLANSLQVKGSDGKVLGSKIIFFNITERKRYEGEILKAKKKAEQAAVAKTEFLSTVSHEIRTPLNAILGLTEILISQNTDPENKEYLDILKFSSNNLLTLINNILDLSRIESGNVSLDKQDFDLKRLLQSIATIFEFRAHKKGIDITVDLDETIPEVVLGDEFKLGQVITNLLANAVKFTDQGTIVIRTEVVNGTYVKFSITDTGIGIAEDKIDAVFEEFVQAEQETQLKYGGSGLGLAISQKILELHGSKLEVKSELGLGTEFYFTISLFPGNKENIADVLPEVPQYSMKLTGARLLLCEDNSFNVLVISKFLKDWDISFDLAENGVEALEAVMKNQYDIILMDIRMPVMDGFQTTQKIRELTGERFKNIPIIAMTASTESLSEANVKNYQMDGYIGKPFNPKELYNLIVKNLTSKPASTYYYLPFMEKVVDKFGTTEIDFDKLQEMINGDPDFLKVIMDDSLLALKKYNEDLTDALRTQNFGKALQLQQKNKIILSLFNLKRLEEMIGSSLLNLEKKDSHPFDLESHITEINGEILRVQEEIKAMALSYKLS